MGRVVYISYPSQTQTCRRCGIASYVANKCAEVQCLNYEKTGHRIGDCEELQLCQICHDEAHTMAKCVYFLYSPNVEPTAPENVSYGTAAKITCREDKSTKETKEAETEEKEKATMRENKMPRSLVNLPV